MLVRIFISWALSWVGAPGVRYDLMERARWYADRGADGRRRALERPRVLKELPDERAEATFTFQ
jgi:hypothetical protein